MSNLTFNPLRVVTDIWQHRYLLDQLIKRDVLLRYRGGQVWCGVDIFESAAHAGRSWTVV